MSATEHYAVHRARPLDHGVPADTAQPALTRCSVVIPVYGNEGSIPELLARLDGLRSEIDGTLEAVFVVDGSPDRSYALLRELLPEQRFASILLVHSRNFGSFAACRTGLRHATGAYTAVMAADLQEPPELVLDFFSVLADGRADLVVGRREDRADPRGSALAARFFWAAYRRLVNPEIPRGGVDVFACSARFRDHLVAFPEANTSLVALAYWLGFSRAEVPYCRAEREHGKSGWTLRKKLRYLSDSIFSFTDLPVRALLIMGMLGIAISLALGLAVAVARIVGTIEVPGYTATILVIAFFAALNLSGLGIVGAYVWRAFENTKTRPLAIVTGEDRFGGDER